MASRSDAALDQGEKAGEHSENMVGHLAVQGRLPCVFMRGISFKHLNKTIQLGNQDICPMYNKTPPAMPSGIYERLWDGGGGSGTDRKHRYMLILSPITSVHHRLTRQKPNETARIALSTGSWLTETTRLALERSGCLCKNAYYWLNLLEMHAPAFSLTLIVWSCLLGKTRHSKIR